MSEIEFETPRISNVVIVHGSDPEDKEHIRKYNLPPQNEREWIGDGLGISWIRKE